MRFQTMDELLAAADNGVAIDQAEHERLLQQDRDQRLMAAITRCREGETGWLTLCGMMGRNEFPHLLQFVWTRLPHHQLITAVGDAWAGCEAPENYVPRKEWLSIFRAAGYHDDETPTTPPNSVTLWRGGTRKTRMAWTADRERAEWFQHRFDHLGSTPGKLWTLTVGPDRLLAHYHEKHRHEDEYVIDPTGIRPKEVR